ncbi:hypothetical protein [Sphingobium yanoikuyae]|uniref:Uncharacterized protein n=1 Tax=Sphingobium yanoikuyae TaxID=13690 RepID=A0A9X7UEF8_SPHYA|nr:hypothetical protein [Sphingobium yanoikuyae]QNG46954.1 hypothetical protein H3V42_04790 [Sphingobium yanoikuyae]
MGAKVSIGLNDEILADCCWNGRQKGLIPNPKGSGPPLEVQAINIGKCPSGAQVTQFLLGREKDRRVSGPQKASTIQVVSFLDHDREIGWMQARAVDAALNLFPGLKDDKRPCDWTEMQ